MDTNEIKKIIKSENLVIGSDVVLKLLRSNGLEAAYLASNAPEASAEDIKRYAELNKVTVETLEVPNDELGILCKKPFSISAIGLKKQLQTAKKRH